MFSETSWVPCRWPFSRNVLSPKRSYRQLFRGAAPAWRFAVLRCTFSRKLNHSASLLTYTPHCLSSVVAENTWVCTTDFTLCHPLFQSRQPSISAWFVFFPRIPFLQSRKMARDQWKNQACILYFDNRRKSTKSFSPPSKFRNDSPCPLLKQQLSGLWIIMWWNKSQPDFLSAIKIDKHILAGTSECLCETHWL